MSNATLAHAPTPTDEQIDGILDATGVSAAFSRNLRAFAQAATPIASRNSIEARIVAPLSHPNNVTIHSVEAIDGVHLPAAHSSIATSSPRTSWRRRSSAQSRLADMPITL